MVLFSSSLLSSENDNKSRGTFSNTIFTLLYNTLQVRNQEFFRAGEVSENEGTSINI